MSAYAHRNLLEAGDSSPDGLVIIAIGGTRPPDGDGELVRDFWSA